MQTIYKKIKRKKSVDWHHFSLFFSISWPGAVCGIGGNERLTEGQYSGNNSKQCRVKLREAFKK